MVYGKLWMFSYGQLICVDNGFNVKFERYGCAGSWNTAGATFFQSLFN